MTSTATTSKQTVAFGKPMRELFQFEPSYTPLNHGSYGTYPTVVRDVREHHLREHEKRPDIYRRFVQPELIVESRKAIAPYLGAHTDEVVLVTNATTGVNIALLNVTAKWSAKPTADGQGGKDAVIYFTTTYGACRKTVQSLAEQGRVVPVEVHMTFPDDGDDDLVAKLRSTYAEAAKKGLRPRLALIDTIVSGPGVRMPWERLVKASRELGMLTIVDGAHSVGQIDLTHLGASNGGVQPDFFVSNCHKWLYVPRACAVFYVPFRSQHLITTSLPTSWGYELPEDRDPAKYFTTLFADVGTFDNSPYVCIPAAIKFRNEVCGGEEAICKYRIQLAREGGDSAAQILGTEVMDNNKSCIRDCALVNVRLPLVVKPDAEIASDDTSTIPVSRAAELCDWIQQRGVQEDNTYLQVMAYNQNIWVRLSAEIYLDKSDFEWGARKVLAYCNRAKQGEWKK